MIIDKLSEEIEFLRDELKSRRADFHQREISLLKIIEIMDRENLHRHTERTANIEASASAERVDEAWSKPKQTGRRSDKPARHENIPTQNRYAPLTDESDSSQRDISNNNRPNKPRGGEKPANSQRHSNVSSSDAARARVTHDNRRDNTGGSERATDIGDDSRRYSNGGASGGNRSAANVGGGPREGGARDVRPPRKQIIIVGDSMTRDLKGWLMSKKHKVTTHSLSGCKNSEMEHLCRALCQRQPSHLIVHCGSNSLYPKVEEGDNQSQEVPMTPDQIVQGLTNITNIINTEFPNVKVLISELIVRADHDEEGRVKVREVNRLLQSSDLSVIKHDNITTRHLNARKLHLNDDGSRILARNFIDVIKNID